MRTSPVAPSTLTVAPSGMPCVPMSVPTTAGFRDRPVILVCLECLPIAREVAELRLHLADRQAGQRGQLFLHDEPLVVDRLNDLLGCYGYAPGRTSPDS
jgi:hypothetical protein